MNEAAPSDVFLTLGWARFLLPVPGPADSWIRVRRNDVVAWHLGVLTASSA